MPEGFNGKVRTMKSMLKSVVVALFLVGLVPARALQSGTPEGALEEIVTAEKPETVIKHLPVTVEAHFRKMPMQERAALSEKLLISKVVEREGSKLVKSSDGNSWEVVEKDGKLKVTITLHKTFISGDDALVQLEIQPAVPGIPKSDQPHELLLVAMHYEDYEWRVIEAGEWHSTDIAAQFLPRDIPKEESPIAAAAASTLRTINTSLVTYAANYPEQGYPSALRALAGAENQEPSPEHAMLLESIFLREPAIKNGYEFRYVRTGQDTYQVTATPVQFNEGSTSFFTDETCVIRYTKESRPATGQDPPVE